MNRFGQEAARGHRPRNSDHNHGGRAGGNNTPPERVNGARNQQLAVNNNNAGSSGYGRQKRQEPQGKGYAFLDHSNINIMAQKISGKQFGFPDGIDDPCTRVIPGKVYDFLQARFEKQGIPFDQMFCYTSDNAVVQHDNMGGRNIMPRVFRKSGFTKREKIVDTYMVADAVAIVYSKAINDQSPGVLSLWTGDMDILQPVIEKALSQKWTVEVWSFTKSLSAIVERFPTVKINELDGIHEMITERRPGWKRTPEGPLPSPTSSFKLQFQPESLDLLQKNWREIMDYLTRRIKLPVQVWNDWKQVVLYAVLAIPVKAVEQYMREAYCMRNEVETGVQQFTKRMYGKSASCTVIFDRNVAEANRDEIPAVGVEGQISRGGQRGRGRYGRGIRNAEEPGESCRARICNDSSENLVTYPEPGLRRGGENDPHQQRHDVSWYLGRGRGRGRGRGQYVCHN